MSDSEDGVFQSADEGESVAQSANNSGKDKGKKIAEKETGPSVAQISKASRKDKGKKIAEKETGPKGAQISKTSRKNKGRKVAEKETGPKRGTDSTRKLVKDECSDAEDRSSKEEVEYRVPESVESTKVSDTDVLTEDAADVTEDSPQTPDKVVEDTNTTDGVSREGSGVKKKGGSDVIASDNVTTTGDDMVAADGRVVEVEDNGAATKERDKTATDTIVMSESGRVATTEDSVASTTDGTDTGECGNDDREETEKSEPSDEVKRTEGSSKTTRRVERRQPSAPEVSQEKSSGWGWGGWGTSMLSKATQSVSTFKSTIGEGFNTVMDTVEMGLGAASPEELAEMIESGKNGTDTELVGDSGKKNDGQTGEATDVEGKITEGSTDPVICEQLAPAPAIIDRREPETGDDITGESRQSSDEEDISLMELLGGLGSAASVATKWSMSGLSNVRSAVKTTGMTIVTGGLDVLETIGKTTYDVLADGDVGVKAVLMNARDTPDLSKVLREAKDGAEQKAKENEEFEEARKAHFGAQFDEFQGLVQLEALESLSAECNASVQTRLSAMPRLSLEDIKPQLVAIKKAFQVLDIDSDDEDEKEQDFRQLVTDHSLALGVNVSIEKLLQVEQSIKKWLASYANNQEDKRSIRQGKEIHQKAIQSLAELTATTVAFFHRSGQLMLIDVTIPTTMYKKIAANLASLTRVACTEVTILSSMFTQCLNTSLASAEDAGIVINPLITDIYLEASNSSTYIQDAFQLLLPILQSAAIQVGTLRSRTLSENS